MLLLQSFKYVSIDSIALYSATLIMISEGVRRVSLWIDGCEWDLECLWGVLASFLPVCGFLDFLQ